MDKKPTQNNVPYVNQKPLQTKKGGNGLGIAAMVIGIIALLGSLIPLLSIISLVLAFVALVLAIAGLVASRKGSRSVGAAIAALILSIITILIFFFMYL